MAVTPEEHERRMAEGERVHAQALARTERLKKKSYEERTREIKELGEETIKGLEGGITRSAGIASRLGVGILKGATMVGKHLKGIKTEDQYIKNKHLYFMGDSLNPAFTPLGRTFDRNNPMELYFGRRGRGMPEGSMAVYAALQQGYEVEQLEVITGLSPQQLMRAIQYLKEKKLWNEDWD